jgi:hypothetical protein
MYRHEVFVFVHKDVKGLVCVEVHMVGDAYTIYVFVCMCLYVCLSVLYLRICISFVIFSPYSCHTKVTSTALAKRYTNTYICSRECVCVRMGAVSNIMVG